MLKKINISCKRTNVYSVNINTEKTKKLRVKKIPDILSYK